MGETELPLLSLALNVQPPHWTAQEPRTPGARAHVSIPGHLTPASAGLRSPSWPSAPPLPLVTEVNYADNRTDSAGPFHHRRYSNRNAYCDPSFVTVHFRRLCRANQLCSEKLESGFPQQNLPALSQLPEPGQAQLRGGMQGAPRPTAGWTEETHAFYPLQPLCPALSPNFLFPPSTFRHMPFCQLIKIIK